MTASPACDRRAVDDGGFFDHADAETGQVVVGSRGTSPAFRQSRRRPAPRRPAAQPSAMPRNDRLGDRDIESARSRSSRERTAVRRPARRRRWRTSATRSMPTCRAAACRSPGAAWCPRRRCRRPVPDCDSDAAAASTSAPKPPMPASTSGRIVAAHDRLDALDQFIAGVDIDTGIAIGIAAFIGHDRPEHL